MPSSAGGRSGPTILCRKAFKGRMGRARSVPAVRDRRVPAWRGNAEQPNVQQVGERVLRRPDAALNTLPGRIAGQGATRRGGRHGLAHAEPALCRTKIPKGRVAPATAGAAPPATDGRARGRKTPPRKRIDGKPGLNRRRAVRETTPRVVFTPRCGVGASAGASATHALPAYPADQRHRPRDEGAFRLYAVLHVRVFGGLYAPRCLVRETQEV